MLFTKGPVADVFLDLVYREGLAVLEFVLDTGGNGGASSPAVSNFATRSLNEAFRPLKVGVDFVAALLPYCNDDRVFADPNDDSPGDLKDPMVASANGSL